MAERNNAGRYPQILRLPLKIPYCRRYEKVHCDFREHYRRRTRRLKHDAAPMKGNFSLWGEHVRRSILEAYVDLPHDCDRGLTTSSESDGITEAWEHLMADSAVVGNAYESARMYNVCGLLYHDWHCPGNDPKKQEAVRRQLGPDGVERKCQTCGKPNAQEVDWDGDLCCAQCYVESHHKDTRFAESPKNPTPSKGERQDWLYAYPNTSCLVSPESDNAGRGEPEPARSTLSHLCFLESLYPPGEAPESLLLFIMPEMTRSSDAAWL